MALKLLKIQCNNKDHKVCKVDGTKCSCPFYYLKKVPRSVNEINHFFPFFCDQCIWDLKKKGKKLDEIVFKVLFEEYQNFQTYAKQHHLFQLAWQVKKQFFQKIRLSKKIKQIFRILRKKESRMLNRDLENFTFYCKHRDILQSFGKKNLLFCSQIIAQKSKDYEEVMKRLLYNPQQDVLSEFPLKMCQDSTKYYTFYKNQFLFIACKYKEKLLVQMYEFMSGQLLDEIQIAYESVQHYFVVSNLQFQISHDFQYLIMLVDFSILILYNIQKRSYIMEKQFPQRNALFYLTDQNILVLSTNGLQSFEIETLKVQNEFCFPIELDIYFNVAGYYQQAKQQIALLFNIGLTFTQIDDFNITYFSRLSPVNNIYPYFDQRFHIIDRNQIIVYIRFNEEEAQIIFRSMQHKKIIRKLQCTLEYENSNQFCQKEINLYFLQNSQLLAIVQQNTVQIFSMKTFKKLFTYAEPICLLEIDQQIQICESKFFLSVGENRIQIREIEKW